MEKNVRLRILLIMELFFERTDEKHGVSMSKIIDYLEKNDISGNRKSIYDDIHALNEYGLSIEYSNDRKEYYLADRAMELSELKLLVDAVHASKFITKSRADIIISHIMDMSSCYQQKELLREVYSEKPKALKQSGFYSMDVLHQGITENKKVSFKYSKWNLNKELEYKHNGKVYIVSPWLLVWADENYYLVAYDSELQKFKHFRVDKISDACLLDKKRDGEDEFKHIDTANYSTNHFGMFSGEKRRVTLELKNYLIGVVLDRFGTDVNIFKQSDNSFKVVLPVVVSNQFFGWVFGFHNDIKILSEDVALQYRKYLSEVADLYK